MTTVGTMVPASSCRVDITADTVLLLSSSLCGDLQVHVVLHAGGPVHDQHERDRCLPPRLDGGVEVCLYKLAGLEGRQSLTLPSPAITQSNPGVQVGQVELPQHVEVGQGGLHSRDLGSVVLHFHRTVEQRLVLGGKDGYDFGPGEQLLNLEQHLAGEDGGEYPVVLGGLAGDT